MYRKTLLLILLLIPTTGCEEDERLVRLSQEAADRQAEQNREMARLNQETAAARKELAAAQRELQTEHAKLEDERRRIAAERLTESRLGPVLKASGTVLVASLAIGFCWFLLFGLRKDDSDEILAELLVQEIVSDSPLLLPRNDALTAVSDTPVIQ